MNPWQVSAIEWMRGIIRFAIWITLVLNGLMLGVFSVAFTFQFLRHAWTWCHRVMFTGSW